MNKSILRKLILVILLNFCMNTEFELNDFSLEENETKSYK